MMKNFDFYVYILTNKWNTTFYVGFTNNLIRRIFEHKNNLLKGFTNKYNLKKLVYFEQTEDVKSAIAREKQFKNWHRDWKTNLIRENNPDFRDLYDELINS
ncbi:MAG: putative endonuclease [Candidatus Berkelbacteria bacterium Athens1014_28]|uniref:Putative endonuclease n=1 Tax=Candidatus Berkelbacteria bacterium Athens1014_28 TaxID=2017145 RepID=A0A554LNF8_9BACT|nr:MAG: putative endonuclease [Candidatus Berkelbacteria bacterium Athens1014_28]